MGGNQTPAEAGVAAPPFSVWAAETGSGPARLTIAEAPLVDQTNYLKSQPPCDAGFHLIYCDPPFYSGKVQQADNGKFCDTWPTLEAYLTFMRRQLEAMAPLLRPEGFLALHCDAHASHYLKVAGDAVFGYDNFRNEIVWHYSGRRQPAALRLNRKHDVILVWAKSRHARMYPVFEPWERDRYVAMKKQKVHRDEDGREWIWGHMGRGRSHAYRIYLDEVVSRGRAIDTVWDIPIINMGAKERLGYPTQKPLSLMTRIVDLLTRPGDWVADFMAGSGTTGEAARLSGRNVWLGDDSAAAIAIMRRRLLASGAVPYAP